MTSIIVGTLPIILFRRNWILLGIAAAAYFAAIISKIAVEAVFASFFLRPQIATYLAYGLLTSAFEIGLAFVFILLFRKTALRDGLAGLIYGLSLSFWENTVFLGFLTEPYSLLSLLLVSAIPPGLLPAGALQVYSLNYIPLVVPHLLDRISSLVLHLMFGFMSFASVKYGRIRKFIFVLPLGFIDSLVAWFDLAGPRLSYIEFSAITLTLTVLASLAVLIVSGELRNLEDALKQNFSFARR